MTKAYSTKSGDPTATDCDNGPSHSPALHKRLAGMESAFHAAPVGLCVLDLNFTYVTVNACFAKMYGLREVDFLGRSVEEALPEPAPQILAHLHEALDSENIVEAEIALQNPHSAHSPLDPDELIYLRTAQPVRDESGAIFGVSVALLDITLRKNLDRALKESEEDLRYTVELTPHIPWTADSSGELTFMSPRWHAITGRQPEEVLLRVWAEALHPEDREKTSAIWAQSVRTGAPYDAEYRIKAADRSWRWVRARAYPRRRVDGEIVRWYGTVEEIHDRKTTSLMLEEATALLARKAQEDYLTGIYNRRHFDEVLTREVDRARRNSSPLSLVLLDVDHFKRFNDIAGHLAGDECLRAVAAALESVIRRPADSVARFGGEEFAIILPETNLAGATTIANHALAAARRLSFEHENPLVQGVTLSAGVTEYREETYETRHASMKDLVELCDRALYKAKSAGRDRLMVHDRQQQSQTPKELNR